MYNILVCDDEKDIRRALNIYLSGEGYTVCEVASGADAVAELKRNTYHLVLMDIMMPGLDGVETTVRIREFSNIPIIFLTAKTEDTDKVLGLTVGGDDYVTKPFNPMELLARVKAQLRRYTTLNGPSAGSLITAGGLQMDDDAKSVTLYNEPLSLTPTEYDILRVLMMAPGKVFSSRELYQAIRNEDPFGAESSIPVHIRHLREKIETDPTNPRMLKVVWGKGYKLES
jgi:DNA-binding response OmpR family regulator